MEFLEDNNLIGLVVGLITFVIIGVFHPIVINSEKYCGLKIWWAYLIVGIGCLIWSFFVENVIGQTILCILAFTFFWSIKEIFGLWKKHQGCE